MIDYYRSLIEKYLTKNLLIDTNILLLLIVGSINIDRISKFKRTKIFTKNDYLLLSEFANRFKKVSTTPNILTEVNSFTNQLGEPERSQGIYILSQFIQQRLIEIYYPSQEISQQSTFIKYGLTDTGIINLAKTNQHLLLTDDFKLASYLENQNIDVINFNHIRPLN